MKVVAINGSPKKTGNTAQAIQIVFDELEKVGIETEMIHIGKKAYRGCLGCNWCAKQQNETCVIKDDDVNEIIQKMKNADGILFGSPVYWAGMNASLKSILDRAFYVSTVNGNLFRHKVGSAVVAVRRSGGIPTYDQMNKYLVYSEMLVASSNYWNVAHGWFPEEMQYDPEGVQIMRVLGKNMAWMMQLVEHGKDAIPAPALEPKTLTGFVRDDLKS